MLGGLLLFLRDPIETLLPTIPIASDCIVFNCSHHVAQTFNIKLSMTNITVMFTAFDIICLVQNEYCFLNVKNVSKKMTS